VKIAAMDDFFLRRHDHRIGRLKIGLDRYRAAGGLQRFPYWRKDLGRAPDGIHVLHVD